MKLFLLGLLISSTVFAQQVPDFMKDGVITVKLKNGKTYSFSTNEYKVVSRKSQVKAVKPDSLPIITKVIINPNKIRHIVSGEIVRSNGDLDTTTSANEVEVRSRRQLGLGIQYQYNFQDNLFLGGRVDTNGGAGINLGAGF